MKLTSRRESTPWQEPMGALDPADNLIRSDVHVVEDWIVRYPDIQEPRPARLVRGQEYRIHMLRNEMVLECRPAHSTGPDWTSDATFAAPPPDLDSETYYYLTHRTVDDECWWDITTTTWVDKPAGTCDP